jgi:zinc finger CCCH domain-containing protein 13
MPRSSRHRSHRSHRRGGSPDRLESEGEEVAAVGAREEVAAAARVSRDPEPERRRTSSGKDAARSGNGYADHGRKRKERVEEAVVDVVSDRWNSGVCEDHLADKRSMSETLGPVDAEKQLDKPKGSGDESKRSSRRVVGSEERVEELVSKSDSAKRRSEREKDSGRRDSIGQYKDDRDRDREKEREREKEWERQKEREREKSRDREREKEREKEREWEREREKDRDREREWEKQKDRERDKKDYDSKHDMYDDGGSRKSGSKTSRMEEEAHSYKRDIEVNGK